MAKRYKKEPMSIFEGLVYCGCGILYVAVDYLENLWGCDWLCALNEYSLGNLNTGWNMDNLRLLKSYQKNPLDRLYLYCDEYKKQGLCKIPYKDLCPRAQCIAENLEGNNIIEKPIPSHCKANQIEYAIYDYVLQKCMEKGIEF
jgi:hypothetical protein